MVGSAKGIGVGTTQREVFVRVVGRGTFQNSQPLRRFALDMIERGCQQVVLDLGECQGMDSTFLGTLAGIALRLQQDGRKGKLQIANATPRSRELLQTLGLDRLFDLDAAPQATPCELRMLPGSDVAEAARSLDKKATAELMLEAHNNLVRADERNEPKFRDLTKVLREDIARQRAAQDDKV